MADVTSDKARSSLSDLCFKDAALWAKHSCHRLTLLYGCVFIENSPNSLHCPLSKYRMHIFEKNTRVNCSVLHVFPRALLALSSWHHAPVTNRPRHNENKKQDRCDICVPLKMCVGYCSVCVQFSSSRACNTACVHVSACVPHTSTHHCSKVERPDLLTVMTRWRVKAFIFPLFYCKYSLGLQGNARRSRSDSENTGRHLEGRRRGGGGEDEACKRSASSNSQDATRMERLAFLAAGSMVGFQLYRAFSATLRGGWKILTRHTHHKICYSNAFFIALPAGVPEQSRARSLSRWCVSAVR